MEDALSADESTGEAPSSRDAPQTGALATLTLARALLDTALGDRVPVGTLGTDNVPLGSMALPVTEAVGQIVKHSRLRKKHHCSCIPEPIILYQHWRRENIPRDVIARVLWTQPDHVLVSKVRTAVVEKYTDLHQAISSGRLFTGEYLAETFGRYGDQGPRILAGVLWATKFATAGTEDLFRLLVPLAEGQRAQETKRSTQDPATDSGSLKSRIRDTERELRQTQRERDHATDLLRDREQSVGELRTTLSNQDLKRSEEAALRGRLEEQVRSLKADKGIVDKELGKAREIDEKRLQDLRERQDRQRELEMERSDLARQLAGAKKEIEQLGHQLSAMPQGADAVWSFIRSEETRLERSRLLLVGGAKQQADQEWTHHRKMESAFLGAYPIYRQPRPAKAVQKTVVRFIALGGSSEIGRSCYLLEWGKHRIVVDCGLKPGDKVDERPAIDRLDAVDALVLTHAHTDHVGWVPALINKFPGLPVYCSEGTAALLPVVLEDCYRHYRRKLRAQEDKVRYVQNADPVEEQYLAEDVQAVTSAAIACSYGQPAELPFGNVSVRFFPAGHILGAASVLVEDPTGRRIFFSGDFSSSPQLTVEAADWSSVPTDLDLLVLESTYGDRQHKSLKSSREDLISFIANTINRRGGSVLVPTFALGRAQEILKLLTRAKEMGQIPAVPIYVDGMIREINPIYRRLANFKCGPHDFYEISGSAERREMADVSLDNPAIIVTTSGMLNGGPIVEYAPLFLPDPRHRIVLTGYQDEGAPSRALRDMTSSGRASRRVRLYGDQGEPIDFEAAMPASEVTMSAHADQAGLVEYAARLKPRQIALVHGNLAAQQSLQYRLSQDHPHADIVSGPEQVQVL